MALSPLSPTPNTLAALPAPMAPPALQVDAAVTVTASSESTDGGSTAGADEHPYRDSGSADSDNPLLDKALDELNEQMRAWNTQLQFSYDEEIGRVVVSVLDAESGDVLRTIPSEEMIHTARMMVKLQGLAVRTTA